MSAAERGIRLAAATLPFALRERYREQWLADVRDAEEIGISRAAIVAGALAFSLRLGRSAEVRGYTVTELMLRRLRWGMALALSAVVLFVALWVSGLASVQTESIVAATAMRAVQALPLLVLCIGLGLLIAAARAANRQALAGAIVSAVGALALIAPASPGMVVPGEYWAGGFTAIAALVLLVVGALLALIGFTRGLANVEVAVQASRRTATSAQRARAGAMAFIGFAVLLAFGTYETLVLGPLAQAPDYTLAEIYAMLSPSDRSSGITMALIWLVFWGLAAIVFVVLCLVRGRVEHAFNILFTPRRILVYALALGSIIIFFHWWSAFSLGMSIADTVPPMRGNGSWQGMALSFVGSMAMVGALLLALVPGPHRPGARAASGTRTPTLA